MKSDYKSQFHVRNKLTPFYFYLSPTNKGRDRGEDLVEEELGEAHSLHDWVKVKVKAKERSCVEINKWSCLFK